MAEKKNILTYEGLKALEDELQDLKLNRRKEVAAKIKEAREHVAYPDLTEDAIRFCCLIKLRLTSAELMSVLNVTKDAIYKRKFRLKKELMPDDDTRSLDDFLGSY